LKVKENEEIIEDLKNERVKREGKRNGSFEYEKVGGMNSIKGEKKGNGFGVR
jgi:hypothetical protein